MGDVSGAICAGQQTLMCGRLTWILERLPPAWRPVAAWLNRGLAPVSLGLEVGMPAAVFPLEFVDRSIRKTIGVDPHKSSHTATALDPATNTPTASLRVDATRAGYRQRMRLLSNLRSRDPRSRGPDRRSVIGSPHDPMLEEQDQRGVARPGGPTCDADAAASESGWLSAGSAGAASLMPCPRTPAR